MSQGPWSIKGIDPRARSAARELAQRRGVTLGQYLNSLLLEEEAVRVDGVEVADLNAPEAAPEEMRRMSAEIDQLAQKIEASQARAARAMAGVDKSILGVMGKLDVSNRAQLAGLERVSRAVTEIEATQSALRSRIETMEAEGGGAQTLEGLRALEASLARLAETVNESNAAKAREQAEFHDLFDKKVNRVTGRIDQIEQQVQAAEHRVDGALDRIAEAANRFELFENKTERNAADSNWRMERALETSVQRSRSMSKELLDRVDGIEEKTRDAINSLGDAVNRITQRISQAERDSGAALKALERSVTSLDDKVAKAPDGADVAEIKSLFEQRLESLADDLSRPIHAVRADVERKVEEALRSNQPEKIERLERTIRDLQQRLQEAESRQAGAVETISAQVDRMSRAVDERLRAVESRPDERSIEDVRREMLRLADTIDARIDQIENSSRNTAAGIDRLSGEIGRTSGLIDERIQDSERRSAAAIDAVGEQVGVMAERLQRRHDENVQRLGDRIEEVRNAELSSEDFNRFAQTFDDRVRESERRSAEAIGQIGEQVARAAERLQNQHLESLRMLETRLTDSGRQHESRLQDALTDMSRRMDEIGEQSTMALNPVHKTVSSLARRLAAVEDGVQMEVKAPSRTVEPPMSDLSIPGLPVPELPDDFEFLDDFADPEAKSVDPAVAAGLVEPATVVEEETHDIVGVEPPPFDRTPDAQLFGKDEPPPAQEAAGAMNAPDAATDIEDLLDTDDVLLDPEEAPGDEIFADLPEDDPETSGPDYLAEARRAAMQGRRVPLATQAPAKDKRPIGRGPLIASAALAVAVAGGGAWSVMRGKQDAAPDTFTKLDPASPQVAEGDPKAAAAVLFGEDHVSVEHDSLAPAASADAGSKPADNVFDDTPPWKGATKPASSAAIAPQSSTGTAAETATAAASPPPSPAVPTITLEEAVAQGDPIALHDKAVLLLQTSDKARGVSLMKEAAGKGLVMAEYRLAKLYEKGEGAPRDMAASRKWTEQAAMGGNIKAMHDLAVFYAEGDAGPQSYAAAVEWFRQAADLGLVDSQYNLAVLYEQGLGVSEDKSEAAYWFEVAAKSGDPDGGRRARAIEAGMTATDADQIRRRARAFTPKKGNPRANGDLGSRPWDVPTSDQIQESQRLLARLGYQPGKPDGQVGEATREAIRRFETDNGLPVSGDATVTLLRQLRAAALNTSG
ncbi:MAG: hypothetical protein GC155_01550 [Alphaproteobacteria bacterium]|nr:hypothetical protein [Alphaproteobacteria bacterium]